MSTFPAHERSANLTRRRLIGSAAAAGGLALGAVGPHGSAETPPAAGRPSAETLAARLHASLAPGQREKICFPASTSARVCRQVASVCRGSP